MRYDSSHKQKTRAAILEEAAAVIREVGPSGVGIKNIMSKVGLTHGGFYAHFRSKDDLVAEAISMMFEERRNRALLKADSLPNRADLNAFIDTYLSDAHRQNLREGCPLPALSSDIARLPTAAKERYIEGFKDLVERFCEQLSALEGDNCEELARSAVLEMVGALALSRATTDENEAQSILDTARSAIKKRLGLSATVQGL